MYHKTYHIHFVGIGGIGMSGIAELLLNLGYAVSGSDLKLTDITDRLKSLGGTIYKGHQAENIRKADVVVRSSAVGMENPEVAEAVAKGIPVIPRAEMLAELMRLKYSVAVAGAHGKTSTTMMVAAVLAQGGLDPTVVIGGRLKSLGTNAVLGQGNFIVAEADESDGSFLKFSPAISVVTNIDREHLDFYEGIDAIKKVFADFIDRIPFYGLAVLCLDNEYVQDLLPLIKKRYATYGESRQADFQIRDVRFEGYISRFTVYCEGGKMGRITLNVPGMHNVQNAMAAVVVGCELGLSFDVIKNALETLEGVQRRLEIKGESKGILVVDDYGHHPTEIKTTLKAAARAWPDRRLVVVFQPHRYSRTKALFDDFATSFYQSEHLLVLPIYAASEKPLEGVSAESLLAQVQAHGHKDAHFSDNFDDALVHLKNTVRENDLVLTLGAGDVWTIGERLLAEIGKARGEEC